MKISLCIPTYNRLSLLKESVNSVLSQTYQPYEILISDDSLNDETQLYIQGLQLDNDIRISIKYFRNTPPLGQLANVNNLIDKATGDLFVLLHDDDLLLENSLETMVNYFISDPKIDAVYGKQYIIEENGAINYERSEVLNKYFFRTSNYSGSVLSSLEAAIVQQFPNDCYMIKMDIAKKMKYGKKELIGNAGDFDFGLRLGIKGYNFFYINQYTAKYRITSDSVARNGTDSGYQSFKLILNVDYRPREINYKELVLRRKSPIAIMQAIKFNYIKDAKRFYFSKWHRSKILTIGGLYRLLKLTTSILR